MIWVPEAGRLPNQPRPVRRAKWYSKDVGKPFGYVRNACFSTTPQISQCPVVESFPAEAGKATPYAAAGPSPGLRPGSENPTGAGLTPGASPGSNPGVRP